MKTADLIGLALDWAVAKCQPLPDHGQRDMEDGYRPSTDWAQGGPIIEREGIDIYQSGVWVAEIGGEHTIEGPTPLVAAMRCYVTSKLGNEVDVPTFL